jgi:steroid delta-isomerase-like uncharacterized protein
MKDAPVNQARRLLEEVWNHLAFDKVDELVGPGFTLHDPQKPLGGDSREILIETIRYYRTVFPDLLMNIEDAFAVGERAAVRWVATGTHQGTLRGEPPTGRAIHVTGMTILRFADGKIVETWDNWDTLGLMQQLGLLPAST